MEILPIVDEKDQNTFIPHIKLIDSAVDDCFSSLIGPLNFCTAASQQEGSGAVGSVFGCLFLYVSPLTARL